MRLGFGTGVGLLTGLVIGTGAESALAQPAPGVAPPASPAAPPPPPGAAEPPEDSRAGPTAPDGGPGDGSRRENLGNRLQFAISAERMMGVSAERLEYDTAPQDTTTYKEVFVSVLGSSPGGSESFGLTPRLAFDFFPVTGFGFGAGIGLVASSGKVEDSSLYGASTEDLPKGLGVVFNPRLGYAAAFNDIVAIWPRAGLTVTTLKLKYGDVDGGDEITISSVAVTLEALLALSPVDHFAILLGPFADIGVGGQTKYQPGAGSDYYGYYGGDDENDLQVTSVGITVGISGFMP